ncbi:MAG TPA: DUF4403 family protein [Gemmatimonadaceae bacterium]|nr:DUF4403 family protein [Gemmatimonadaceae bacterium]
MHRWSLSALALIAACSHEAAPVARPIIDEAPPPPPAAEQSRFSVPLEYDFTSILRIVERAVPLKFGSIDSVHQVGDDTRRHFAFEAERGPFTAFAQGNLVHLEATLAYAVRGFYKPVIGPTLSAGCGGRIDERPRMVVELATPLTLTSNWHLGSQARLVRIAPASDEQRDHCDVSLLRRDITPRVIEAATSGITGHLPDIDKKIGEIDLQKRFAEWWRLLERPIRLTDGVWLLLGPEQLSMGRVRGTGRVLRVPVTLAAHPRIVTVAVADTPHVDTIAIPPLGRDSSAGGFHILMDGLVDYQAASTAVAKALVHRKFSQSGKTVTVDTAFLTPAARGRLALSITFSGDAKGTLRFLGGPTYDAKRKEVTVPDLDYDLATDNQIINTYAWLKSDDLRAMFRERAHVPVAQAIDRGKSLLLVGLNRKIGSALTLSATVDSVAVRGIFVTRNGIVVRGIAAGQAGVVVRQR